MRGRKAELSPAALKDPKQGQTEGDEGSQDSSSDSVIGSHDSLMSTSSKRGCLRTSPRVQALMRQFAEHARMSYLEGMPALTHLPLLVKLNALSALAHNADILGVSAEYSKWEGISPFSRQGANSDPTWTQRVLGWPKSLHPTPLQSSIDHHPWIDLFPWPQLRNNMLQAFEHPEVCDEDELCRDLCEYSDTDSKPSLIVWGPPWDPRSWEVSDEFLQKWAWLLSGCVEIIEATNYWRTKRGEPMITPMQLHEAMRISMSSQLCPAER